MIGPCMAVRCRTVEDIGTQDASHENNPDRFRAFACPDPVVFCRRCPSGGNLPGPGRHCRKACQVAGRRDVDDAAQPRREKGAAGACEACPACRGRGDGHGVAPRRGRTPELRLAEQRRELRYARSEPGKLRELLGLCDHGGPGVVGSSRGEHAGRRSRPLGTGPGVLRNLGRHRCGELRRRRHPICIQLHPRHGPAPGELLSLHGNERQLRERLRDVPHRDLQDHGLVGCDRDVPRGERHAGRPRELRAAGHHHGGVRRFLYLRRRGLHPHDGNLPGRSCRADRRV